MNITKNQLVIIERPNDKSKKWPYVIGGFVAGVASIIGAAYFFDVEGDDSSHSDEEIEEDFSENNPIEDITESTQSLTENS